MQTFISNIDNTHEWDGMCERTLECNIVKLLPRKIERSQKSFTDAWSSGPNGYRNSSRIGPLFSSFWFFSDLFVKSFTDAWLSGTNGHRNSSGIGPLFSSFSIFSDLFAESRAESFTMHDHWDLIDKETVGDSVLYSVPSESLQILPHD